MKKKNSIFLIIFLIISLVFIGCDNINNKQSVNNEKKDKIIDIGDIDIENYPDKIKTRLDEFLIYDKAWDMSYKSPLLLYNTRKDIDGNYLVKVKKVTFSSTNVQIVMIFKNISNKTIAITKKDYVRTAHDEVIRCLPNIKLNANEIKEIVINIPKKYMWSIYDGVNMEQFQINKSEFYIAQYDDKEKITDVKPVEKFTHDSSPSYNKYSTIQKNFILGNKKAKILCDGVDILDTYKNGIQGETAYIGYAKFTIANTSNKDIIINDEDISMMLSLNGKTETDLLHNNKTLPKFSAKTIKPSEIKTFKIPVILSSELWTRINIEIDNQQFIFAGIENLQID